MNLANKTIELLELLKENQVGIPNQYIAIEKYETNMSTLLSIVLENYGTLEAKKIIEMIIHIIE